MEDNMLEFDMSTAEILGLKQDEYDPVGKQGRFKVRKMLRTADIIDIEEDEDVEPPVPPVPAPIVVVTVVKPPLPPMFVGDARRATKEDVEELKRRREAWNRT